MTAHPVRAARWAGLMYLAIIALGLFGESMVRGALVTSGDPAATMQALAGAPGLWRAGIAGDLLMHVLDLPLIVFFYLLLRPVSPGLAMLATGLNLIQTAVLVANKLNLLLPLYVLDGGAAIEAFTPAQAQGLAYLGIKAHGYGFGIGLVFFGVACLVRGHLLWRCGYLPKTLGALIAVAGGCYLVNSAALLLAPALADRLFPAILMPALVGELALALWLLVRGVDGERWRRAASAALAR